MPAAGVKKASKVKRNSENEEDRETPIDVQYNPEVIEGILSDLKKEVESKCNHIQRDVDFMCLSLQQAFSFELIKLPTSVKQMSLAKFREEFGDSLDAVTRETMGGGGVGGASKLSIAGAARPYSSFQSVSKDGLMKTKAFQTPSENGSRPAARNPREGESIMSANGSPLGEFSTVVKAPRDGANALLPPTPATTVVLRSGAVVSLESAEGLDESSKQEALDKMQALMQNMQAMMSKLEGPRSKKL